MNPSKLLTHSLITLSLVIYLIGDITRDVLDITARVSITGLIVSSLFLWQNYSNTKNKSAVLNSRATLILFLIPASAFITSVFSVSQFRSFLHFFYSLIFFYAALIVIKDKSIGKFFPALLVLLFFLIAIIGIKNYSLQAPVKFPPHLLREPWSNKYLAAEAGLMAIFPALAMFISAKKPSRKALFALITVFLIIAIILTQSIISITILILFLPLYTLKQLKKIKRKSLIQDLFSLTIILAILFFYFHAQEGRTDVGEADSLIKTAKLAEISRADTLHLIISSIKNKPLFGYGPDTTGLFLVNYVNFPWNLSSVLHNFPATIAIEQGVIGLIAWTILITYTFKQLLSKRKKKKNPLELSLYFSILAWFLHSFIFGLGYVSQSLIFSMWILISALFKNDLATPINIHKIVPKTQKVLRLGAILLFVSSAIMFIHTTRLNKIKLLGLKKTTNDVNISADSAGLAAIDPEYLYLKANILKNTNNKLRLLDKSHGLDKLNPAHKLAKAEILYNANMSQAKYIYQEIINATPFYSIKPYIQLSKIYIRDNNPPEAQKILQKGAKNFILNEEYYDKKILHDITGDTHALAVLYLQLSELDHSNAKKYLTIAMDLDPEATRSSLLK